MIDLQVDVSQPAKAAGYVYIEQNAG
jgi:hypothetical protein